MNFKRLDLQAKISLILVAVLLPTFILVTIAVNQFTQPILREEMRQVGISAAKALATEITTRRLLHLETPTSAIESQMKAILYQQPSILRMDVLRRDPVTRAVRLIASSVEQEGEGEALGFSIVKQITTEYRTDEELEIDVWRISVPIENGSVHATVALNIVGKMMSILWKITGIIAPLTVILLVLVLSYLLRKTIANDRKLRATEDALQEAHRQLMHKEKLAVMGQLTASFAHEIGTPLNAIGGHLQLLKEEIAHERLDIIGGQLRKIEQIVRSFLQSTAKPGSRKQLVDLNRLADQTLRLVRPRADGLGVEVRRRYDRSVVPVRAVPLDLEQVLLNVVNNSLDSLASKASRGVGGKFQIEIGTATMRRDGRDWAILTVHDTGEGIAKANLRKVMKPFFTTKPPTEGTGLGLTISRDLARKYGGTLEINSKKGGWTKVSLELPYETSGQVSV